MSLSPAAQLVLQAAGLGQNGAVYVLDMGEPVKIVDLAHDLIRLSGFEPGLDIAVEVVGARPGEKMFEELLTAEEGTSATRHEKIFCVKKNGGPGQQFHARLGELFEAAETCDDARLRNTLRAIIPTYEPRPNGFTNVVLHRHRVLYEVNGSE